MAGLGRKVFTAGEVLTAANVQGYLADQAVMRFASSAARATAIGTATEGMMAYLDDTNEVQQYNGTAWEGLVTTTNVGSLAPQGNAVINGGFDIWQRGTSFVNPNFYDYTADRWRMINYDTKPTSATHSQQAFTPGTAPVAGYEGTYFYRSSITTVGTCTQYDFGQYIEDARTISGKTFTISFYAKSDSARTQQLRMGWNAVSPGAALSIYSINTTTAWQRFTITFDVPSMAGRTISANSVFYVSLRQAAASGSVLDIWGVQLEAGTVATPFKRNAPSIQAELAACQRYYYRNTCGTIAATLFGTANSTTSAFVPVSFPVEMRTTPSSIDYASLGAGDGVNAVSAFTSVALNGNSTSKIGFILGSNASGLTTYRPYYIGGTSGSSFLGFSAEL